MPTPIDALRSIHDALWDEPVGLVRLAPGAVPGVEIGPLDLHAVRESALGAFLDLEDGRPERTDRADRALRTVLTHQHTATGVPWSGTFRVTAEEADPPGADAVEWFHYDPNWRQFLGCILTLILLTHRDDLAPDLAAGVERAVERCVEGEPEGRIPAWYTNPNLMHAWLTATVGVRTGDAAMVDRGTARARAIVERFERYGDVDEYNSPTYDGIDLFAVALWVAYPPTPAFAEWGRLVLDRLCWRMGHLFHPALHAVCGPYLRAYGLSLRSYVSLAGLWLTVTGIDDDALPPGLDPRTTHVHDLFFLPVFAHLHTRLDLPLAARPVDHPRSLTQTFGPVVATSILHPGWCLGFEQGRTPDFSKDQYLPVVAFAAGRPTGLDDGDRTDGRADAIGLALTDGTTRIDGRVDRRDDGLDDGPGRLRITAEGVDGATDILVLTSSEPTIDDHGLHLGALHLTYATTPEVSRERPTPDHHRVRLRWRADRAEVRLTIDE